MSSSQIPQPPLDMVVPELPLQIFTAINLLALLIFFVLLLRESMRCRSPLPLLFLAGGGAGILLEPLLDFMCKVWYPLGPAAAITAFDVAVPYWVWMAWAIYFGAQSYYLYRALERGMDPRRLYWLVPMFWVSNIVIEVPGLSLGLYTYYGEQAFQFFGFPVWMGLENAMGPVSIAVVMLRLKPWLNDARIWLTPIIVPAAALACASVVGFPMWLALNSGGGSGASIAATFVVAASALLLLSIYVRMLTPGHDARGASITAPSSATGTP